MYVRSWVQNSVEYSLVTNLVLTKGCIGSNKNASLLAGEAPKSTFSSCPLLPPISASGPTLSQQPSSTRSASVFNRSNRNGNGYGKLMLVVDR